MSFVIRRYLPHVLVIIALASVMGVAYASVVMTTNGSVHATWNPMPANLTVVASAGTGTTTVTVTCSQPVTDVIVSTSSTNPQVTLTASPTIIPLCSSTPTTITLTATCNQPHCDNLAGRTVEGQVVLSLSYNNYYNYNGQQQIPPPLPVLIRIVSSIPQFTLSPNPPGLTCNVGQTVTSTVTVTPSNGFSGPTTLSTSILPSGLISATLDKTSITSGTGNAVLTVNCAHAGSFNIEVRGVSNYETKGVTIPVTVSASTIPNFTMSASPSSVTCLAGGNAPAVTITVTKLNGFASPVTLTVTPLPSTGISGSVVSSVVTAQGSTILNIACANAGTYNIQVTGTSGSLSQGVTIPVSVTSPTGSTGDFTMTADQNSLTGTTVTTGITITGTGSFTGDVPLTVKTLPNNGLTCTLAPNKVTINTAGTKGTSTLSCTASSQGHYTVTVSGSSNGKNRSVNVSVDTTNAASNAPAALVFGIDPAIFWSLIAIVIAGGVGSGLFLLRRTRMVKPTTA